MIGEKFVKKVKKLINDENRATIQRFLLPAVVITFFVGIILSYYNMLYSQTRDSIIKNVKRLYQRLSFYKYGCNKIDGIHDRRNDEKS